MSLRVNVQIKAQNLQRVRMTHRCEVCDEVFNKSNHSLVNCAFCDFKSCTLCNERYLLETTQDAHCMSCRKGWTRETLMLNFTAKFVTKDYKTRRENLLLEREKSLMPATQVYVEFEKKIRKLGTEITAMRTKLGVANGEWTKVTHQQLGPLAVAQGFKTEFEALMYRHKIAQEHRKICSNITIDIQGLEWEQNQLVERINGRAVDMEKRAFVRSCPHADCKGFLSTAWKCSLCDNWSCPTCHEVKGQDRDTPHTCDPNNVATAELLARDSRGCPNCAAMIFKINGCDQMWCTQCHTAFSWRTGRIETHTVHNPHYYEYQRTHGTLARQPGDVPCGGMPEWHTLNRLIAQYYGQSRYNDIVNAYRSHGHAQYSIMPRYQEVNLVTENRDLRVKLMIGDIQDDEFKKKIQQREKANQRKRDIRQVVEMYMTIITDLFQACASTRNTDELYISLIGIRDHYNATLEKVAFAYKCAVPSILPNFSFRV